jgi:hypothetical protein
MMMYEETVKTHHNNNDMINRIHKGMLGNLDTAKVVE